MNKIIKEQLTKTKIVLPLYDDNTLQLFIPKHQGPVQTDDLLVGHNYDLYLEDYIIHEPANFTLSANWNNGTKPIENRVHATVTQFLGKMVKIYTVGITTGTTWEGWVPQKGIKILGELNV